MTELGDPGWRSALPAMVPLFGRVLARQLQPQIAVMRALWISFASSVVWITLVIVLLMSGAEPTGSTIVGYVIVTVATLAGIVGTVWARRNRAKTDPLANDAAVYRKYFFLCIAFSELPALAGFVSAFVVSRAAPYYLGGAIALVGFAIVAPTRRFLAGQGPLLREAMLATSAG